jgi:hypothetical protein
MEIQIPHWAELKPDLQNEFAPRTGANAAAVWDSWDMDRRLRLLHVMAVLRRYAIWPYVATIEFGTLHRVNRWFWKHDEVKWTPDGGWWLGITTAPGVEGALDAAGFENRLNLNHIENQTNYMEPGDGTVMHWGRLIAPYDEYTTLHFDSGGGRLWSREHFKELRTGKGLTNEQVTRDIIKTPAGFYLQGICPDLEAMFDQGEVDQIFGG